MNKSLLSVLICLGLAACSSTDIQQEPEDSIKIERPFDAEIDTPDEVIKPVEEKVIQSEPEHKDEITIAEEEKPVVTPPKPLPIKTAEGKLILGTQEWVYIPGLNKSIQVKVDTDASTSLMSAVDVVSFEREGKNWVKFRVENGNFSSKELSLPILRWIKGKQADTDDGEQQKHPVVTTWVQLGEVTEKASFTLVDKTQLTSPMVLGKDFLRDIAIVDMDRKLVQPKAETK